MLQFFYCCIILDSLRLEYIAYSKMSYFVDKDTKRRFAVGLRLPMSGAKL